MCESCVKHRMQEAEQQNINHPTLTRLTEYILKNGDWIWLEEKSNDGGESWAQFGVYEHKRLYIGVWEEKPAVVEPQANVGVPEPVSTPQKYAQRYTKCPECNSPEITIEAGCPICHKCGWSKC